MNTQPDDPDTVSTALSTLSARVAVLERWMRGSRRRCLGLVVLGVVALVVWAALLATR
jgi:hypothetical protein